jgi:hypothetical protein
LINLTELEQYFISNYFVANIISSVGYGDFHATSDIERLGMCIIVILSAGVFSVGFGSMINLERLFNHRIDNYLEKVIF